MIAASPMVGQQRGKPLGKGLDALLPEPDLSDLLRAFDPTDPDAVEKLSGIVRVIAEELERHVEGTEGMSAETMYRRALAIVKGSPSVWERIKADARAAARECRRFSMKKEIEILRDEGRIKTDDLDYKFNSSVTAALTRFLVYEVPEVGAYVSFRSSKVDKYFGEGGRPLHGY